MNKNILSLLLAGCALMSTANTKMDIHALRLIEQYRTTSHVSRNANSPEVKVMMLLNDGYSFDDVDNGNVYLNCDMETGCYIVTVKVSDLEALAANEAVARIEHGPELKPILKTAREISGVDAIHNGSEGLPQAYDGTGILCGVFDTGFDPTHPAFYDAEGKSRIKMYRDALWRCIYSDTETDTKYIPENYIYKSYRSFDLFKPNENRFDKTDTHGTQCAGILAGAPVSTPLVKATKFVENGVANQTDAIPFYGLAKNADIFMVDEDMTQANVLECFKQIAQYGKDKGQPVVLSLSQAIIGGPHDGSTLFNREMEKLGESNIIVIGVGNSADTEMAIDKELTAEDPVLRTTISFSDDGFTDYINIYSNDDQLLTPEFGLYDITSKELLFTDKVTGSTTKTIYNSSNGTSPIYGRAFASGEIIISNSIDANNNRAFVYVSLKNIKLNQSTNSDNHIVPVLLINGKEGQKITGTFERGFCSFKSHGIEGYTNGTTNGAFNDLVCGKNVISAGAYTSKNSWYSLDGKRYSFYNAIGSVTMFSSFGTTADGVSHPTVLAPGQSVAMPLNFGITSGDTRYNQNTSYAVGYAKGNDDREYYWGNGQGTSFATPFVAGTIALWLQANPALTYDDVVKIIKETSETDATLTNSLQHPIQAGAGRINALAGIKKAIEIANAGVEGIDKDIEKNLLVTRIGAKQFEILYGGTIDHCKMTVYSLEGKTVDCINTDGNRFNYDASALTNGIYLIELTGDNFRAVRKIAVN